MAVINPPPDPAPVSPGAEADEPLRPRAGWYWLGALLIAGSIVVAVVLGVRTVTGIDDQVDEFARVDIPGRATVELDAGGHTLYLEYPGASLDGSFSFAPEVVITAPDGRLVPLEFDGSTETYNFGGREGRSFADIDAPVDGAYLVEVRGEPRRLERVAIGDSFVGDLLVGIFGSIAIAGLGVLLGLIVIAVTAIRRSRALRRRRAAGMPPGGWGAPPGAWGAPSGGWAPPPPSAGWAAPGSAWAPPPPAAPGGWAPPPPSGGWAPPPPSGATAPPGSTTPGWAPPPPASSPPPPAPGAWPPADASAPPSAPPPP